jgi:type VI secretion system secreted protein VgrG
MDDQRHHHQLFFTAPGLSSDDARVRHLVAHEGLSSCFLVEIDLELCTPEIDPNSWIGDSAEVVVVTSDGTTLRRFGGVITKAREQASVRDKACVVVTLESPLSRLRWTTDYRIFQDQTTENIVSTLIEEHGISSSGVEWKLTETYPKREVCTQFGESSFTFVSRLLEEDGIFYFHEFGVNETKIVFADASAAYPAIALTPKLLFRAESGLSAGDITEISEFGRIHATRVTLRDHDFKHPALSLETHATTDGPLGREHYDYPGRYVDPSEGARRAKARLDAMAAASMGARGVGSVFAMTAGHTFDLSGAPDSALDREWVVREVEHVWNDSASKGNAYQNRFTLLPSDVVFRPPATTAEVDVPGPQLAVVTGPSGEEIHTDEFGRVKVRFPWDRRAKYDEKSSAWVRVGQMHSSGSVVIPRIGWEVVVDFEGGDPDRPIVLGRVYNGQYTPPYKLPNSKTQTSLQSLSTPGGGGHNEIRMEDSGGGEHIHVHAQKDMNVAIASNKTQKVKTSSTLGVGSNHTQTVGASSTLEVGVDRELNIGGSQTWTVGASRMETVSGDERIDVTGSRTLAIGASHTTMTPMAVSASTPASFTETIAGSAFDVAGLDVGIAVAGSANVTVGGAEIAACATGASSLVVGAHASTVGGAFISASGADCGISVGGAKATTVGGVWAANAGGDVVIASGSTLNITVGGALAFNATSVSFKVGASNVTLSGGSVIIKSPKIKLTATGPHPELAPMVKDK